MKDPQTTADVAFAQSSLAYVTVMALAQVAFDRGDPRLLKLANVIEEAGAAIRSTMVGPDASKQAISTLENELSSLLKTLRERAKG